MITLKNNKTKIVALIICLLLIVPMCANAASSYAYINDEMTVDEGSLIKISTGDLYVEADAGTISGYAKRVKAYWPDPTLASTSTSSVSLIENVTASTSYSSYARVTGNLSAEGTAQWYN